MSRGGKAKPLALGFLTLASAACCLCFLLDHPGTQVLFALLASLFPVALMVVGASRKGRTGRLGPVFLTLALLLLGGVGGMLAVRGQVEELPWVGGLPLAAAFLIYAVFLGPLFLISLAYGLTFERESLQEEELAALRRDFSPPRGGEE